MTEDDLTIDPRALRNRKTRRPLPPGQTRHLYDDEDDDATALLDDDDDSTESEQDYTRLQADTSGQERHTTTTRRRTARKKAPKSRATENVNAGEPRLLRMIMDRRVRIWTGLILILVAVAMAVILLSYIHYGALDQTLILNMSPEEIAARGLTVKSGVGPFGAWLGHVLFAESFGVGAFVLVAYLLLLGYRLLAHKKVNFWALTLKSLFLTVASSIIIGLLTFASGSSTFWGGIHGYYINKWLLTMTGVPGAMFITICLIVTLIAIYFNQLNNYWKRHRERAAMRREARLARQEARKTEKEQHSAQQLEQEDDEDEDEEDDEDETDDEELVLLDLSASAQGQSAGLAQSDDSQSARTEDDTTFNQNAQKQNDIETVFEIDTPVDNKDQSSEPGFEVNVATFEKGQKSGSVAERLVAEQGEIDPRAELSRFKFPTLDMLEDRPINITGDAQEQEANKERIIKTLGNYGITIENIKATVGPTVTLYEIVPTEGVRIAQIKRLEDDIALSLAAKGIRIIAPMPGKGTVGIEVPNREPQVVSMRTILASKKFSASKAKLPVALGATISNEIFVTDLAAMPHALVAGATGQGKSVGLNVLITSLLYRKHPSELKFVLIDPKMVEFSVYERLRGHYLASLPGEDDAIVTDPSKVLHVLNSLCTEMDNRYALLRNAGVNKIEDYNRKYCQRRLSADKGHQYLPYIVVIIDEFADLIMTGGKDIELPVMRITQKARAVGIHMIIATQRPSTNVLTGLIKANCPSRIAFRVLQNVDSRTILDRPGAEQLIGRGDMLYSQGGDMERMQCAFISSDEVETICDFIDNQPGFEHPYILPEPTESMNGGGGSAIASPGIDRDPLFAEAARFVVLEHSPSTSSLQRRFLIGYNRAGRIMDQLEACGIVGSASGSKQRPILVDADALERILSNSL